MAKETQDTGPNGDLGAYIVLAGALLAVITVLGYVVWTGAIEDDAIILGIEEGDQPLPVQSGS